jgi:hypothetical protein
MRRVLIGLAVYGLLAGISAAPLVLESHSYPTHSVATSNEERAKRQARYSYAPAPATFFPTGGRPRTECSSRARGRATRFQ